MEILTTLIREIILTSLGKVTSRIKDHLNIDHKIVDNSIISKDSSLQSPQVHAQMTYLDRS